VLNNLAAGVVKIQSNSPAVAGTGRFENSGTLLRDTAGGAATVGSCFDNLGGTIDVETGTLTLGVGGAGGSSYQGGNYTAAAGAALDLTGGTTVAIRGTLAGAGTG